jgi:hypothetical protein
MNVCVLPGVTRRHVLSSVAAARVLTITILMEHKRKDKSEKKDKKDKRKDKKSKKDKSHKKRKREKDEDRHRDEVKRPDVSLIGSEPLFEFQKKKMAVAEVSQPEQTHTIIQNSTAEDAESPKIQKKVLVPMSKVQSQDKFVFNDIPIIVPSRCQAEAEKDNDKVTSVFDEDTGRWRLTRGGEIIERIVSASEHRSINKQATHWISRPGAKGM